MCKIVSSVDAVRTVRWHSIHSVTPSSAAVSRVVVVDAVRTVCEIVSSPDAVRAVRWIVGVDAVSAVRWIVSSVGRTTRVRRSSTPCISAAAGSVGSSVFVALGHVVWVGICSMSAGNRMLSM